MTQGAKGSDTLQKNRRAAGGLWVWLQKCARIHCKTTPKNRAVLIMCVWFEHVLEYAEELRLNVYNRQSQFMGKFDSVDLMIADDLDAFMINQKPQLISRGCFFYK